jgi:hypoxanthine phosphoribosyltransferase
VRQIARRIERDYEGLVPHLVTVMKGGLFFLTDLARALRIPHTLDFLAITSYGPDTHTGEVRLTKDLDEPIAGRHVIVVEDILGHGADPRLYSEEPGATQAGEPEGLRAAGPPLSTPDRHPHRL